MTDALTDTGLDAGAQALWLLQKLVPDRGVSNAAVAIELDRAARWWPLQEAVRLLVDRHPALRTGFPVRGGVPVRETVAESTVPLDLDVYASTESTIEADLRAYAARPFDLALPPLIRVGQFVVGQHRQVICLVAQHIVVDAASLGRLVIELGQAYRDLAAGAVPPELPAPTPVRTLEPTEATLEFWRSHLAGRIDSGTVLDGGRMPEAEPSFAGELVERSLDPAADRALVDLRKRCRATDAIVLLAAYYLVLRQHGGPVDSVVGVMTDTRGGRTADAVGYHVATLPLRVSVEDDLSFTDLVSRVTRVTLAGFEHGTVPYEVLAEEHTAAADDPAWWRSRLVRHLFNFRPGHQTYTPVGEGSLFREVCTGLSRFDLELTAERVSGELIVKLLHSTEVYGTPFAERFLARLEEVLRQAVADPHRRVGEFDLRTDVDRRLVSDANRTQLDWLGPKTVLGMIRQAAVAKPDAVAVRHDGVDISYRCLLATAASVRDIVLRHGATGASVAIAGPRCAGTIAAVLGVWAAGANYLPLDPTHPVARLSHQLADADVRLVLGAEDLPEQCRQDRICLPTPVLVAESDDVVELTEPAPENNAYLIYTSGSTGLPKGVWLRHANLANVVRHFVTQLGTGTDDAMAWLTTFAFDISALEMLLPLVTGGMVVVVPDQARAQPERLIELVERDGVSVIQATPTTWRQVAPSAAGRFAGRTVLCGGEPLSPALAVDLLATGARVLNVYGPTETTIWSSTAELADGDPVTIGRPIANTQLYVLTEDGRQRPVGLVGELCIGGAGVAPGYHRRPELTGEKFPVDADLGRYYRTGDLARWRADGTVELLGRSDRQVKLRAHRIELGEIEAVLETYPEIRAAAVVLNGDPAADGRLVAFVVARQRAGLAEDLWAHAAAQLPGYCVPSSIVAVDALPTTANGKLDLRELTLRTVPQPSTVDKTVVGPSNDTEAALVELWRVLLGRPNVGPDANFFLSGGNSLLAVQLADAATARCDSVVTMGMVFRAPTPATLAALINPGEPR